MNFSFDAEQSTYLVRGEIADADLPARVAMLVASHPDIVGVFADPQIEPFPVYCGSRAVGTATDVSRLLGTDALRARGMDGTGVAIAVVDTGINVAHLRSKGLNPTVDASRSWTPPGVTTRPGQHPVAHGTMCAYDVLVAAPKATLIDVAVMLAREATFSGFLSDAVAGFAHLRQVLDAMPAGTRRLVASNSWGMFSPTWDFPVGSPGNYSDNPAHPFNVIVASLAQAGADIVFAAGNCGRDCADSRCQFGATRPICGANSHAQVLCVAGIDTQRRRLGYSSQGPGRLFDQKPDVSAYTHFLGSEAEGAGVPDSGTSAACPVLAGVIGAVRTRYPATKVAPAQLRSLVTKTSANLGPPGFDYDYGWGAVDPAALATALDQVPAQPAKKAVATKKPAAKKKAAATKKARKAKKAPAKVPPG
jgi:subtilisin family serine protease